MSAYGHCERTLGPIVAWNKLVSNLKAQRGIFVY